SHHCIRRLYGCLKRLPNAEASNQPVDLFRGLLSARLLPLRNTVCDGGSDGLYRGRGAAGSDAGDHVDRCAYAVVRNGDEQPEQWIGHRSFDGSVLCADTHDPEDIARESTDVAGVALDGWDGGCYPGRGMACGE